MRESNRLATLRKNWTNKECILPKAIFKQDSNSQLTKRNPFKSHFPLVTAKYNTYHTTAHTLQRTTNIQPSIPFQSKLHKTVNSHSLYPMYTVDIGRSLFDLVFRVCIKVKSCRPNLYIYLVNIVLIYINVIYIKIKNITQRFRFLT